MYNRLNIAQRLVIIAILLICSSAGLSQTPTVTSTLFGTTSSGIDVMAFTLTNSHGLRAKVIEYGGTLVSLEVPDRNGTLANIVRGYDNLTSYSQNQWTGAIIGRYANRIANAKFTLDGVEYHLTANSGANQLHGGGANAFSSVVWQGHPYVTDTEACVLLTHLSLDGEEGYPGNLNVMVTYALTDSNELRIDYSATTDKPTVINMTNHSYFNLAGIGNGDILNHVVMINADYYTYAGSDKIPTGEIFLTSSALNYKTPQVVGTKIGSVNRDGQYDHNYVLNTTDGSLFLAASAYEPTRGRFMECYTDQPGMQFYTGDRSAFCFETQHFPDSPNKPHFPSTVLRPGTEFKSTTTYKFSTK